MSNKDTEVKEKKCYFCQCKNRALFENRYEEKYCWKHWWMIRPKYRKFKKLLF